MKKIKIHIIGAFLLATTGLMSCEDYLDKAADTIISEDEAFQNFRNFQGYTEELYNGIVDFSKNYWTNSLSWAHCHREVPMSETRIWITAVFNDPHQAERYADCLGALQQADQSRHRSE